MHAPKALGSLYGAMLFPSIHSLWMSMLIPAAINVFSFSWEKYVLYEQFKLYRIVLSYL